MQPLELQPCEHHALVLHAAPLLGLVSRDHVDAAALVVELLQRVALRVADHWARGERQPLALVTRHAGHLARALAGRRAQEAVPVSGGLQRLL